MRHVAKNLGLTEAVPIVLSEGGNVNVHLSPYPLVVRLAVAASRHDAAAARLAVARELKVARHLHSCKVPVLLPVAPELAGPHRIGDVWLSLWQYVPPVERTALSPVEAVALVTRLSAAMRSYPQEELPRLGVWERAVQAAARLVGHPDRRIGQLLDKFSQLDQSMRSEAILLGGCHGDAHAGNLLACREGWIWNDFEDVSRMPLYWDLASYLGNKALFQGLQEPTLRQVLSGERSVSDPASFGFALAARVAMSTVGNLDFAFAGYGDESFAFRQLERIESFWQQLNAAFGPL